MADENKEQVEKADTETKQETEQTTVSPVNDSDDKKVADENTADSGSVSENKPAAPDYKADFEKISRRLDTLETTLSNFSAAAKTPAKSPTPPKKTVPTAQPTADELEKLSEQLDL